MEAPAQEKAVGTLCTVAGECSSGTNITGLCTGNEVCCLQGDTSACSLVGGTCDFQDNCEIEFAEILSGLCPGSSNIKCCVPTTPIVSETCAGQDEGTTSCIPTSSCSSGVIVNGLCSSQTSNECCLDGSDTGCTVQDGVCRLVEDCDEANGTAIPGLCPGSGDVKCCLPPVEPGIGPIRPKCFPLQYGSLAYISQNWGSRRSGGARCK